MSVLYVSTRFLLGIFFVVLGLITSEGVEQEDSLSMPRKIERRIVSKAVFSNSSSMSGSSKSWTEKRSQVKSVRLEQLVKKIEKESDVLINPEPWSSTHQPGENAVFAAAMAVTLMRRDVQMFCGTLRKTGFKGDIVVAVQPGSSQAFLDALKDSKAIVYTINADCIGSGHDQQCSLPGHSKKFSINMMRFQLYTHWAKLYSPRSLIMLSDFRDVMFQSDPFKYRPFEWAPPVAQLAVFQEAHPNKVINRCMFNSGWIRDCYGEDGLRRIGSNTVSCSGVSVGERNAIMAYAYLMLQQLNPSVRYGKNNKLKKTSADDKEGSCKSTGMDQGLHNWLVYSGNLERLMDVKIFQQGEGPVNTVGAFFGTRALLKFTLEDWGVLKGVAPNKYFSNWNGDKSPVIHQADRFLGSTSIGGYYTDSLEAAQGLGLRG